MRRIGVVCALIAALGVFPSAAAAQDANQSPSVTAARTPTGNVRVGVPISFTATGTDPDGDSLTYAWDFGDGTTSTDQNPTKSFLAAATRTVTVTVSDGKGGTGSATLSVVVQANRNPSAAGLTVAPQAGFAPLHIAFGGAATDPDGPSHTVSYAWDLDGDGTDDSTAANPTTTYTTPGTYLPRVRVTDPFGGSATRTFVINVLPEAEQAGSRFRVLIYSRTAGFRHSAIDEGITALKLLGAQNNFHVDAIEEPTLFTDAVLAKYDVVVFLSTTGDTLPSDDQQAAFERYIRSGHGYVGIHSAADTEYLWPWYGRLVGGYFRNHPNGTTSQGGRPATVVVEDGAHPSTTGLPAAWPRIDEWYNYQGIVNPVVNGGGVDYSPRNSGVHVLLRMDESTYAEADGSDGVDDDHPISWCHRFDGGRAWYTGMGHTEDSYLEPLFLQHILGGLETAAGVVDDPACGVVSVKAPGDVTGTVPATLALTVSPVANLGIFTPGLAHDYTATLAANVISTAGEATLSVADLSPNATGHLVNGAFSLPQPLLVAGSPLPAAIKTWSGPVSNEPVTIEVKQPIGATDALRTGTYSKTLTFTLSTNSP
jgi:cytochrome c